MYLNTQIWSDISQEPDVNSTQFESMFPLFLRLILKEYSLIKTRILYNQE